MNERDWLTELFQQHKRRLAAVAYPMLGSVAEAEDALQEAWLRIRDQDPRAVDNMQAWLTTVVGRVCLNMLRSRRSRREIFPDVHVPDPVVTLPGTPDPERAALVADSVGLALLVVLDSLAPEERLAVVLHDVFGVPFSEIAAVLDRSESAVQQLASRARRRVQTSPTPDRDLSRQRLVVDAFFAAAHNGDFETLLHVLDPDVELRIDGGRLRREVSVLLHGAKAVAGHTRRYSSLYAYIVPAVVNGAAGVIVVPNGRPYAVMGFTTVRDRIIAIDALVDPERLNQLNITIPPA